MGQPCSSSDKKETDPDLISGARERELSFPAYVPQTARAAAQVALQLLQAMCIFLPVSVLTQLG